MRARSGFGLLALLGIVSAVPLCWAQQVKAPATRISGKPSDPWLLLRKEVAKDKAQMSPAQRLEYEARKKRFQSLERQSQRLEEETRLLDEIYDMNRQPSNETMKALENEHKQWEVTTGQDGPPEGWINPYEDTPNDPVQSRVFNPLMTPETMANVKVIHPILTPEIRAKVHIYPVKPKSSPRLPVKPAK